MYNDNTLTFPLPRLWIGILVLFQILLGILPVVMPLTYLPIVFIPALIAVIYYKPILSYLLLVLLLPNYGIDLLKIGGDVDISLLEPAVFMAFIGLIFLFIKKQRLSVHLTEVEFAMFLLFLWTAFSIFWTPIQLRGFQQIIKISIGLVIYFISTTMITNRKDFNTVVGAWVVLVLVVSVLGTYETFTTGFKAATYYTFTPGYDKIHRDVRTTALFEGADMVGFITSLVTVLIITYLLVLSRGRWKTILLISLPLASFTFLTAMSRKSFVALLGALFFMQLMLKKKFLSRMIIILIVSFIVAISVILIMGSSGFIDALSERVMSMFMSPEESIKYRLDAWTVGIDMFKQSPLIGKGLGSFYQISLLAGSQLNFPHNFYVFIISELGLVGLFFLIFWWFQIGAKFVKLLKNCANEEIRVIGIGIIGGLITIAIHMTFRSFSLTDPTFWGYMGLTSAFLKLHSQEVK